MSSIPGAMAASSLADLVFRQIAQREEGEVPEAPVQCDALVNTWEDMGLRIASVFIILVGSLLGAVLPIYLARASRLRVPQRAFFIAKYFGSGVILATAFMHLLAPASEALSDECLRGLLPEFDWAFCIAIMTVMVMFFIELMVSRYDMGIGHAHGHSANDPAADLVSRQTRRPDLEAAPGSMDSGDAHPKPEGAPARVPGLPNDISYPPGGEDHLGHHRDHDAGDPHDEYGAQMTALIILEFGVVFHSFFIGLALSGTDNLKILLIVITFHQFFEGLGLGSRLATASWPSDWKRWTPWAMAVGYAVTTPLAIAIGLGIKGSLAAQPDKSLLANGIFDAISGGILLYVSLVELLAHEFMFNPEMRKAPIRIVLYAYGCVVLGAGLMILLAKWA